MLFNKPTIEKIETIIQFIQEISIKYNIDKKNIIKDFLNYIIYNYPNYINSDFLNFVDIINKCKLLFTKVKINYTKIFLFRKRIYFIFFQIFKKHINKMYLLFRF